MKCSLGSSNFLEETSSLSHSLVSLYFLALITEEDFLISPCYSLELCIQMGISFLFPLLENSDCCFRSLHMLERCCGEGNGNPLQYSCVENPMDGGAWWAAVHGVAQSRTWLKWLSSSCSRVFRHPFCNKITAQDRMSGCDLHSHPAWVALFLLSYGVSTYDFIWGKRSGAKIPEWAALQGHGHRQDPWLFPCELGSSGRCCGKF